MPETALRRASRTVRHRRYELLLFAVAVALGFGSLLAVPAAAAEAPEFDDATATVTQSDVATIDVDVGEGGQATLTIEPDSSGFAVESTIEDTDGDGTVPVRLDTTAVAPDADDPLLTAADGGAVRNVTVEDRPRTWALPADNYDLNVRNDAGETDVAVLVVQPQIALDGADEGITLNATSNQTITGRAALDPGETLEIRIQSSGSSAYLVTDRAAVRDDRTFAASVDLSHVPGGSDFELRVRHDGARKASAEGHVAASDAADSRNGTDADRSGPIALEYGGDRIELASAPNRTVRGTADLAAGTELEVRLRSSGGSPFLQTDRATVDAEGDFAATFNMSEIRPGAEFTVVVRPTDGTDRSVRAPGVVVQPEDPDGSAPVDIDDGTDPGGTGLTSGLSGALGALGAAAVLAIVGIVYMLGLGRQ